MKTFLSFIFFALFPMFSFSEISDFESESNANEFSQVVVCADTIVKIDSTDISLDSASIDVFPDPAHDTLCVKYVLLKKAHVSVKIYELTGTYADTLFEGDQGAGSKLIEYRTIPLKNGNYVIEILVDATEINKRITIQK